MIKLTNEELELLSCSISTKDKEVVEESTWESEGKYETAHVVFKYKDKNYILYMTRSGSYYTDYSYQYEEECPEVEPVTVEITKWKEVNV